MSSSAQQPILEYAQRQRFQKSTTVAEAYDPYSASDGYEDEEEEVAAAEWN